MSLQAITEREGRFRALVSATADILYVMNPDWSVMQQLDGRGFLPDTPSPDHDWLQKYIFPEDQPLVKKTFEAAIRNKRTFELEHRVLRADGMPGWTLSRAVPVLDDDGNIIEWFGAASDITERKEAQDAFKEQKRLYETITSSTPDLIYVFDLSYRFTYANQALLTMWGKTWETAVGKGLRENGYEEWHALMHEREIDQVRATKTAVRGEVSFPHAVLGRRIYDYILTPVLGEDGEVVMVAGTTRDITDIRNAETAVSESERRFRTMAEATNVLIAVSDETGAATYFNAAWSIYTGLTIGELLQYGWANLMHPDDKERVLKTFYEAFERKEPFNWEFRMPDPQGGYHWLLTKGTPRFQDDGTFAGYISSSVDITARKIGEEQLQALNEELTAMNEEMAATNEELLTTNEELATSEQRLKELIGELQEAEIHSAKLAAIVTSSDDAIIGKNLEGIVTSWNRGAEQIFGYPENEMIGQSILKLIPEDRHHEEPVILSRMAKGERIDHYETIRQRSDGGMIHVSLTISPIFDKDGRVTGISKIARDISEQKRDEQRKNDFIGMASHELKTPLTSLSALIQVLQAKLKTYADPFVPQALAKSVIQIKRMSGLINGFLNVSRLESGKLEINTQTFDLSALVTDEVEEIKLISSSHQFSVQCEPPVIVVADSQKIGSVISNLLSNAVKYSPKGSQIRVHCAVEHGEAILSVQDEGTGISAQDLPRIFDRYYRAESEQTRNVAGFGVGLYLCAEIIQRHQGRIWAESEKGNGSTFIFALPQAGH